MPNRQRLEATKIKSFVMTSLYDWIAYQDDCEQGFCLFPVDGFALVEKWSCVSGESCDMYEDEVAPFCYDDMGFSLCQSFSNYLGIMKRGEPVPEWVSDEVAYRKSKKV